jgi:hypothetical protein
MGNKAWKEALGACCRGLAAELLLLLLLSSLVSILAVRGLIGGGQLKAAVTASALIMGIAGAAAAVSGGRRSSLLMLGCCTAFLALAIGGAAGRGEGIGRGQLTNLLCISLPPFLFALVKMNAGMRRSRAVRRGKGMRHNR